MPFFETSSTKVELRRDVVILDTNVLYAAFNVGDSKHEDSRTYIDVPAQLIVPMPVIVETWGLLVGRDNDWEGGFSFLRWIIDPSSGVVVIHECSDVSNIHALASSLRIDCVDAAILHLADDITKQCKLSPACVIATYDTRDFFQSLKDRSFGVTLLDMHTLDETEFNPASY